MDGSGEFFRLLIDALAGRIGTKVVSYPPDQPLDYRGLLPHVTSRFPETNPFFLLGESFSGPLAAMAGALNPPNLKGIILVATFVKSPVPPWVNRLLPVLKGRLLDFRPRTFLINRILGRDCPEETRRWIHEKLPRLPREVLAARVRAVLSVNVREELKACRVPVLYIAASRDWVVPRKCLDAVWLCRPDVRINVLDGPHTILQCRPRESAQAIMDFCGRVMGGVRGPMSKEKCGAQHPTFNVQR